MYFVWDQTSDINALKVQRLDDRCLKIFKELVQAISVF